MKRVLHCLLLSFFLVNVCHSCLNITLHNVTFNATNFEYILQWNIDKLEPGLSFSVQCLRYGHKHWLFVSQCENITRNFCNLTDTIIGDVEDFMENEYYGRVRASYINCSSDWVMSKRLNPREDTYLVLPKPSYTQHVRSITIFVLTPSVTSRSEDSQLTTVEEIYGVTIVKYHLTVFSPDKKESWSIVQRERKFEITGLNPNTEYNGSVHLMIGDQRKSDIQYFVVKTLPDLSFVTLIFIVAAVMCAVLLYICRRYVKQKAKTPSSLNFQKPHSIQSMSIPTVECSSLIDRNFPNQHQLCESQGLQDGGTSAQLSSYASQQHNSALEKDLVLTKETPIYKHQKNSSISPVVRYGGLLEEIKTGYHNANTNVPSKASYNSQMGLQGNVHQPFLDTNSGTWKMFTGDSCHLLSLLKQEPNDSTSLGLMSTLIFGSVTEIIGQEAQTDEHPPVVLSELNIPVFADNLAKNYDFKNCLPGHGSSPYKEQHPVANSNFELVSDRTLICEQPYRLQQCPGNIHMQHFS